MCSSTEQASSQLEICFPNYNMWTADAETNNKYFYLGV